eukprot:scaffold91052_cov39-Phaeocystis_antarctica.AAC.1
MERSISAKRYDALTVKGRLYALSQRRFQGTLKPAPHASRGWLISPDLLHETSLAVPGPSGWSRPASPA